MDDDALVDDAYSAAYQPLHEAERPRAGGSWDLYCGTVIAIAGVVNAVYGVAAISGSDFFDAGAQMMAGSVKTWGWLMGVVGLVQLSAALAIWSDREWGRLIGVLSASVNAIVQLMWLPAQPLAALSVFALDLVVIYGLMRHGQKGNTG